jgi:hypothetical protein
MAILDKYFNVVTGFHLLMDLPAGGGTTTLASAATKGGTTLELTAATNFAIGDDIRVGSGEQNELVRIQGLTGTTVTTAKPLLFAHTAGEPVVEQGAVAIGVPEADGARFGCTVENTDVFNAMARLGWGVLRGYTDMMLSWRFMAITSDALATALGIPRDQLFGDGTAAAQTGTVGPRLFTSDGVAMGASINCNAVITGTLNDGSNVKLQCHSLSFDPTAVTYTLSRGAATQLPVRTMMTSAAWDFTNTAFAPATTLSTYEYSDGDQFEEMLGVAELTDSGTATTTSGSTAAGAYSITVASATGIVAGDWVRVGSEYHYVHGVVSNTLNLRTRVLRTIAGSTAVVKQTVTDVGGIDGGFTFAVSGQASPRRSETHAISLSYRLGNLVPQFSFNVTNLTPESLQRWLALPASAYNASVMGVTKHTVGKQPKRTFVFTGLTQNGRTLTLCGWNGSAVTSGDTALTQATDALLPIAYRPKVIQHFVHA